MKPRRSIKERDIQTQRPEVIGPETYVTEAAQIMHRLDVGVLPVCQEGRLIGLVTDQDPLYHKWGTIPGGRR